MTKRALLLLGSAVLNAVLLATFIARPALAPPTIRQIFNESGHGAQGSRPTSDSAAATPTSSTPSLWSALQSGDTAQLIARLREAGFPPTIIRGIVEAEIERIFRPRLQEIARAFNESPYWKPDVGYYAGNFKLFEDLSRIYRERSRVLRDLLGPESHAASGGLDATAYQRMQFGNLPAAKIELVQRINDDYNDMMGQVRSAMQGIALPEDREKLALLEREKRADLASVLTPEELAAYEMRASPITSRLRGTFNVMDVSEAEFRSIYRIHEQYRDVLYPTDITFYTQELMERRRDAQVAVNNQIKTALGDSRYAEYQRANDSDFQQLYRLGQRDGIAMATLIRAYDVRNATTEAATRIFEDRAMTNEQKRAELANLATNARSQLLAALGPSAGPAYLENSRWMTSLQQGRLTTFRPEGGTSTRSLPERSSPPRK